METLTKTIVEQVGHPSAKSKIELINTLWSVEAESRLSAYKKGEIQALDLNLVLSKYR